MESGVHKNRNYDDIINTEWNESSLKERMNVNQRAKIFLPFAALTGFEDELDKTLAQEIENMKPRTGAINFHEEIENEKI
ncbi:MAG: hypothetical protein J5780_02305 [Treponema sp.]|nr:hypothetical protein [Treponema sp.]